MAIHEQTASFDVVVVGGGFSGVCAAIAAAREGAKVALVQNRPVFGGSGSSETRMHIVGANCHSSKPNLRETGILEEILLENKRRNPYADFPVFDTIVWEKVRMEPNITILLNTNIDDVVLDGDRILAVTGCQNTTETRWTVYGKIFIDATGHGTVGVMAGAESRIGSESKHEFNEPTAPEEANNNKMGNTIMFTAIDRGEPVTFIKPVWANTYSEEDLKYRPHVDRVCAQAEHGENAVLSCGECDLAPVADGGEALTVSVQPALPAPAGNVGQRLHIGHRVVCPVAAHAAQEMKLPLTTVEALLDCPDHVGVILLHRQAEDVVKRRRGVQ